jgi:hypothetical protein
MTANGELQLTGGVACFTYGLWKKCVGSKMIWTVTGFDGYWQVGTAAVVSAESIEAAIKLLELELFSIGLKQKIKPEQLVPMPTEGRMVRILCDGNY